MAFTLVFDGDIGDFKFNPLKTQAGPYGVPVACGRGDAMDNVSKQEEETERLEEALHKIAQWSKAYPLTVFPEPDFKKAAELLKVGGMTLDAISASNMRHVEGVGKIASDALSNGDAP